MKLYHYAFFSRLIVLICFYADGLILNLTVFNFLGGCAFSERPNLLAVSNFSVLCLLHHKISSLIYLN
jgi:hypothetical protein